MLEINLASTLARALASSFALGAGSTSLLTAIAAFNLVACSIPSHILNLIDRNSAKVPLTPPFYLLKTRIRAIPVIEYQEDAKSILLGKSISFSNKLTCPQRNGSPNLLIYIMLIICSIQPWYPLTRFGATNSISIPRLSMTLRSI
jgi:hypothetical protein